VTDNSVKAALIVVAIDDKSKMAGPIESIARLINRIFMWWFELYQFALGKILAPTPPPPGKKLRRPRIAVVGAGLTGVAAASHCVGHGFDVMIFEAGGREALGGIWAVRISFGIGVQTAR